MKKMSDIWDVFDSQLQKESEDLSIDDNQSNEVPINDNLGLHFNGGIDDMAIEDMDIEDMDNLLEFIDDNTANQANYGLPLSVNDIFDNIMGDTYAVTESTEQVVHIMEEVEEVVEVVTSSSNESDIPNTQIKPTKRGRGRPKSKLSKEEKIKLTRERNKESAKRYRQRKREERADKNEV
ncbi:unnamed protein product [Medioppia subpectinata]|uniref:BZIP domain-containing protein n=1 Tax=Medioppia subpectinata TaxID=1979941 RepID=A0A7R9KCR8_9ACAR|nr:unnamed protein product [Medioppia subpectinata]CAG2101024.1 unnamed protein product [Medioppia subpectinata]